MIYPRIFSTTANNLRYDKEFSDYQHTDSYKHYLESQREGGGGSAGGEQRVKKKKKTTGSSIARDSKRNSFDESDGEVVVAEPQRENANSFDIPIFTEEFLDHNKARELELRQLRKQTTEFEEQNAVLGKHIDSMKSAISKLEVETVQQRQNNAGLQQQLDMLRQMVVSSFRGVQLPGNHEPLTLQSVDQFVSGLHSVMVEQQGQQHTGQLNTVKDIVSRMDFNKIQG